MKKNIIKLFETLGIAFSVLLALFALIMVVYSLSVKARTFLERRILENAIVKSTSISKKSGEKNILASTTKVLAEIRTRELTKSNIQLDIPGLGAPVSSNEFGYKTFQDFFTGVGWVNLSETSFWHDESVGSFIFEPAIEWKKVESMAQIKKSECVKNCYKVEDKKIMYGNREVALPTELSHSEIKELSVFPISNFWMLGAVIKKDGKFYGYIYKIKEGTFTSLSGASELFSSDYLGSIGIGGTSQNILVMYGGYKGELFQIKNNKIIDLSHILNIRVMSGGFVPEIVYSEQANDSVWYVFNKNAGRARLLKLFENKSEKVEGIIDLAPFLGDSALWAKSIQCSNRENNGLYCRLEAENGPSAWELTDFGFKNNKNNKIVSANINNESFPVTSAKIVSADVVGRGIVFSFSNDGKNWISAPIGKEVSFSRTDSNRLFWKLEVDSYIDTHSSPFLKSIRIEYNLKRS